MKKREEDNFSKSSTKNPRNWWKKSNSYFKPFVDRNFPCEDDQDPQSINDNILYE